LRYATGRGGEGGGKGMGRSKLNITDTGNSKTITKMKVLLAITLLLAMVATVYSAAAELPDTCPTSLGAGVKTILYKFKAASLDRHKNCKTYFKCFEAIKGKAPKEGKCRGTKGYFDTATSACVAGASCTCTATACTITPN